MPKRALALAERRHGPDHLEVGQSLNNLAEQYRAQGRYAEAEPLLHLLQPPPTADAAQGSQLPELYSGATDRIGREKTCRGIEAPSIISVPQPSHEPLMHDSRNTHPITVRDTARLSRRELLLMLAGSLTPISSHTLAREARPLEDVVIIDGWVLRVDDVQGIETGVG